MKFKLIFLLLVTSVMVLSSCEKEDPVIPNEEEVITSLIYTLTPSGGGTPIILSFQDLDGDGGNAPVITEGTLAANTIYEGVLELKNEQAVPVEDITVEILAEDEDHQFFFQTNISSLNFSYTDQDANELPVGLSTNLTTAEVDNGIITITLRHLPNKSAPDVDNGDITNAGGETDIEVSFNINVL